MGATGPGIICKIYYEQLYCSFNGDIENITDILCYLEDEKIIK